MTMPNWTTEQITRAARALSDQSAESCGIDKDEHWTDYKKDWLADAAAILQAATDTPIRAPS